MEKTMMVIAMELTDIVAREKEDFQSETYNYLKEIGFDVQLDLDGAIVVDDGDNYINCEIVEQGGFRYIKVDVLDNDNNIKIKQLLK